MNIRLGLICLFFFALFLRGYGLDFGLPHTDCRPDETTIIQIALNLLKGDLNPHFFHYPSLFFYVLASLYWFYMRGCVWLGTPVENVWIQLSVNPEPLYLISRALSAFAGALTIFPTFYLVRQFQNQKTAWVATFLVSVCFLHVRDSHFGTTDIGMTLLTMTALYFIVRYNFFPDRKTLVFAGLFTGLALSTKYGAIFLVIPMILVLGDQYFLGPKRFQQFLFSFLLYIGAVFFVFAMTSPYIFLDFSTFYTDFTYEMQHLKIGHHHVILGQGWWYHLRYTLPYGLTWPIFFLAFFGFVFSFQTNKKIACYVLSFPCALYFSAGQGYTVFVRYMVPITPFFCIFAAIGLWQIHQWISRKKPLSLALITLLFAVPSLYKTILLNTLLTKTDTRVLATEWIYENIPAGAVLYQPDYFVFNPLMSIFPSSPFRQSYSNVAAHAQLQLLPDQKTLEKAFSTEKSLFERQQLQWQIHIRKQMAIPMGYQKWEESWLAQNRFPDYIILQKSLIQQSNQVLDFVPILLQKNYHLLHSFESIDLKANAWYDQQDAFYLPFTNLQQVIRPGPNIFIYQRKK